MMPHTDNRSRGSRSFSRLSMAATVTTALLLATFGASRASAAEMTEINQAGFRVLYMAPVFVAIDKGFFNEHGVNVTFKEIDSGALGPAAVLSGSAQVSDLDPAALAALAARGRAPLLFYNLVNRVTLDFVVRNEAIESTGVDVDAPVMERAKALQSLNIGITRPGAPTDVYPRYFLASAGLDPERDANLIQIGSIAGLEAAFRSGTIDGFFLSPPLPQKLEKEGLGKIMIRNTAGEVPALTDTTYVGLFTTREYAESHAEALTGYSAAIQEAVKWLNDNPDEAVDFLAEKWFSDTDKETLALSLEVLLPAISGTGKFQPDSVMKYMDVDKVIGVEVAADVDPATLWTNEFVEAQ